MNKLSAKQIVEINNRLTSSDSGETYIEAVNSILNEVYRKDEKNFYIYKDSIEKASVLACELFHKHVFKNGSLMTSIYVLFMFLSVNGVNLFINIENIQTIIKKLTSNNREDLNKWIVAHCIDKYKIIIQ